MDKTKVVAGVAVAAVVAAVGYYLLQPVPMAEEKKTPPKPAGSPQKAAANQPKPPKVEELPADPPKHKVEKLTLKEYLTYVEKMNQILIQKLTQLKKNFVENRRAHANNPTEYEKIVEKYKVQELKIWESACSEMLEEEKVDSKAFEVAHEEFLNKHEVAEEKEKLKTALTVGKLPENIDLDKIKEIMQMEIKLLSEAENSESSVKNLETISRIEDKIFDVYGLEIENVRAASQNFKDQVKGLTRQILRNYSKFRL
ncbi:hypothetical protein SteCoe_33884 [Stentor coeruleus]|uniref:Uncharacterized protein n=1 Tax=Stentor coeruleus TaxID=5963 RepID=A0A1R2AVW7_9CILI|nr:hypothetical protein SteCoe_33884 [Stentor coeruleus]